jgi:hypothetical protein
MASTITLFNTVNWASGFLDQQPLEINGQEPALGSANLVLQTILGPPFCWPWNRAVLTYTTAAQDYTASALSSFGFMEGASVQAGGRTWEVMVKNLLQSESQQAKAMHVSPLIDDGQGNITFRLSPAPDQSYVVTAVYQKKAPTLYSLAQTWTPVPDEKNYICQWGFLALMSLIGNDARFNEYNTKFVTGLLGAQGGLTDLERNIFLSNWTRVLAQMQGTQLATTERYKAREV